MDLGNIVGQVLGGENVGVGTAEQQHGVAQGLMQLAMNHGGLSGLLSKLRGNGLGSQVDSWVSTGPNEGVQPHQVEQGLGQDAVQQLATHAGISPAMASTIAAAVLPMLIDRLTPGGQVPQGNNFGTGGGLGGILGGLMGR
jgi:uncharacterized protein YidB (DUF937 family)